MSPARRETGGAIDPERAVRKEATLLPHGDIIVAVGHEVGLRSNMRRAWALEDKAGIGSWRAVVRDTNAGQPLPARWAVTASRA